MKKGAISAFRIFIKKIHFKKVIPESMNIKQPRSSDMSEAGVGCFNFLTKSRIF